MVERAPFLNAAYSAYHHRGMPAEDEEMTRVGPDTPGGEYLRRFWQPVNPRTRSNFSVRNSVMCIGILTPID